MPSLTVNPESSLLQGPDTLRFNGKFSRETGPIPEWGIPDTTDERSALSFANSSGTWTDGLDYFRVHLFTHDGTPALPRYFSAYSISGEVVGHERRSPPSLMYTAGDERITPFGFHVSHPEDPLIVLTVEHRDPRAPNGRIIVRCMLGWTYLPVPENLEILVPSRIHFKGILDGISSQSGRLVIQVLKATIEDATLLDSSTSTSESVTSADP
ncbi:hypothetical protein MJO29_016144 [Puccinia striiformis f. sp. tritici]|uniref:hypothetical protein n=1 Tax=Puccinia striiformis f. sp. tritici TaxID=168172 RepID=UPI0020076FF1|nr:hypothetical protein Pst134EA_030414 [Puccinia striiformis f. sp. tritici]KAH9446497.1 hypothetical protein Pst134EA_030414 [Puccinia striiformis f. sp. tritici]KAI7934876.1 hypothetical protein MJO29_016139 [Puccinia striiformis f. sp. tritici]KAI7934881.1 hypothetical protein MJO29_016144 [Puccinia striiformis f. sp. tritici]